MSWKKLTLIGQLGVPQALENEMVVSNVHEGEIGRLLDTFPLSTHELTHLLALEVEQCGSSFLPEPALAQFPELRDVLRTALGTVFVVSNSGNIQKETFLETICCLLGRRGERILWEILFNAFRPGGNEDAEEDHTAVEPLMSFLYRCAVVTARKGFDKNSSGPPPIGWIHSLSSSSTVCRSKWKEWTDGNELYRCIPSIFYLIFADFERKLKWLDMPLHFFSLSESISMVAMGIEGPYHALYDSDQHGLSFRIFQQALLRFQGPTVLLIRTKQGDALGYYSTLPWKISTKWYGANPDNESFLFRLSPSWNRYRRQASDAPYHQYLNIDCPEVALRGLAVGGVSADAPRLYLTEELEHCRCAALDHLFSSGPLLHDPQEVFFDVDLLQVWAVCSEQEFQQGCQSGQLQVQLREGIRQRFAQVDRSQFAEDIGLLTNLFEHRQQTRGRTDFVAHDNVRKGYYIQEKRPSLS